MKADISRGKSDRVSRLIPFLPDMGNGQQAALLALAIAAVFFVVVVVLAS